jgi:hypothetical protein
MYETRCQLCIYFRLKDENMIESKKGKCDFPVPIWAKNLDNEVDGLDGEKCQQFKDKTAPCGIFMYEVTEEVEAALREEAAEKRKLAQRKKRKNTIK